MMVGCQAAAKRHCLSVFGGVGLISGYLCSFKLSGLGEERRWSGDGVDLLFVDLVHNL